MRVLICGPFIDDQYRLFLQQRDDKRKAFPLSCRKVCCGKLPLREGDFSLQFKKMEIIVPFPGIEMIRPKDLIKQIEIAEYHRKDSPVIRGIVFIDNYPVVSDLPRRRHA